jgi:formaldehyde-activating enzyme involved in methanogenesis
MLNCYLYYLILQQNKFQAIMCRIIFLLLVFSSSWSQKLHHQVIATQGGTTTLTNGVQVVQSIGQVNSTIGNRSFSKFTVGQGFIQSFARSKATAPVQSVVEVTVYPNPVVDIVNFQFSSNIGKSITFDLFDARGRLVLHQKQEIINDLFTTSLATVAEGVYFVKIQTPTHILSTKLLKSK